MHRDTASAMAGERMSARSCGRSTVILPRKQPVVLFVSSRLPQRPKFKLPITSLTISRSLDDLVQPYQRESLRRRDGRERNWRRVGHSGSMGRKAGNYAR